MIYYISLHNIDIPIHHVDPQLVCKITMLYIRHKLVLSDIQYDMRICFLSFCKRWINYQIINLNMWLTDYIGPMLVFRSGFSHANPMEFGKDPIQWVSSYLYSWFCGRNEKLFPSWHLLTTKKQVVFFKVHAWQTKHASTFL